MNYFLLDAVTGELRTARPLDKEAIENKEGKILLTIKVSAYSIQTVILSIEYMGYYQNLSLMWSSNKIVEKNIFTSVVTINHYYNDVFIILCDCEFFIYKTTARIAKLITEENDVAN